MNLLDQMEPDDLSWTTASVSCGMIAVVGCANVGKSTLVNAMLGEKVSIISPVAQTTRNVIRSILTEKRGQLVFLDTPGVHYAAGNLGNRMNKVAQASVRGVDMVVLVLDGSVPPKDEDRGWIKRIQRGESPCLVVVNKSDKQKNFLESYQKAWREQQKGGDTATPPDWLKVSAQTGNGVPDVVDRLFSSMPMGPYLFPPNILTDFPRRLNMADIIREKLIGKLTDELPHSVAVWIDDLEEGEDGWYVTANIYVQKESQKPIVIGHKGRLVRSVQRAACRELSEVYEVPVDLRLKVKVEKNWTKNFWLMKKFGYAEP